MMRRVVDRSTAALLCALPLIAGALTVDVGNPAANPEALSKGAALVMRTMACRFPEKTTITATAEGIVDGKRQTVALKLIPLSNPGTFAITHEWPSSGTWAVKIVAKNPEYKDYVTGALVSVKDNSVAWESVRHCFHEPTDAEVASMLGHRSSGDRAALK